MSYLFNPAYNPDVRQDEDDKRRNRNEDVSLPQGTLSNSASLLTDTIISGVGASALLLTFSGLSLNYSLGAGAAAAIVAKELRPSLVVNWGAPVLGAGVGAFAAHNLRVGFLMQIVATGIGAYFVPRVLGLASGLPSPKL